MIYTRLLSGASTHPGIARSFLPNEDSLFALQGNQTCGDATQIFGLFVVADGMGGHAYGQEASRIAVRIISSTIVPVLLGNAEQDRECFLSLLQESVQRTNEAIYRINQQNDVNLGTTVTSALIIGTDAYIASVGDSRTYLYRSHMLSQITNDHSVVAQLIAEGLITSADVYTHPKRNQLYRNIGRKSEVAIDLFTIPLQVGDKLLLCSDGLWEMVHEPEIQHIMEQSVAEPVEMVDELIHAALRGGGKDNVSVVVVFAL